MALYEDQICEAIEILVDNAIKKISFNRTIQCIVQSCEDAAGGRYKVKYQDSSFSAYAINKSDTYSKGTSVWVLVINNDMSKNKIIIDKVH